MNTEKGKLFKKSKRTAQNLAKRAIKSEPNIEEGTFPIYMVVSSHDKNDDIMFIHPIYPVEFFQDFRENGNSRNDKSVLFLAKEPVHSIKENNENDPEDKE
ncbi:MAG TPA: hypothetical protein VK809_02480 [Bacteroidia bacterium]|jgi:hypothetical protein|nr:hypothetical protein [Bacteroidia bacterium]